MLKAFNGKAQRRGGSRARWGTVNPRGMNTESVPQVQFNGIWFGNPHLWHPVGMPVILVRRLRVRG